MRLTVRLFAALRERAGRDELVLEDLPDGLDVGGLKREVARRHPELGSLEHVAGVVGTEYARDARPLAEGEEVALLPPVSGGTRGSDADATLDDAALERGVFELRADPLDPGAAARAVGHPACGAICTFVGTTRDTNRGQDVVELDYEAFERMAGPEMERIFAACRAELDPERRPERRLRMLCWHRVGRVGVGEPSVVIAVASPHRDAAFQACRLLIDRLKESLPVWKREVYADGHHWIGDRS